MTVTLTVQYRIIWSNTLLPGGFTLQVGPQDWPVTPPTIFYQNTNYEAQFWNISGTGNGITMGPSATVHIGTQDVSATAWYVHPGGNGKSAVTVWAFSETQDAFLQVSPIDSVLVGGVAQPAPFAQTYYTDLAGVVITAKSQLDGEPFHRWVVNGAAAVNGLVLTEAQGQSDWLSLACYALGNQPPFRIPREFEALVQAIMRLRDWGDPPGREVANWLIKYGFVGPEEERADYLTELTARLDTLDEATLRRSLAQVKAAKVRLAAAEDALKGALKGGRS